MKALKLTEILKLSKELFKRQDNSSPYNIKILSNISCNQIKSVLEYSLLSNNIYPEIEIGGYDNIVQDSYNQFGDTKLMIVHYDLFNIVEKLPFFIEEASDNLIADIVENIKSEIDTVLSNLSNVPLLIFPSFSAMGFYQNPTTRTNVSKIETSLNNFLHSKEQSNLHILDLSNIISHVGVEEAYDMKMFYLSKTLYSLSFVKEYVESLSSIIFKYTGKTKKAIIFDCDNTLWKGILGEDGEGGIDMSASSNIGGIYHRIQSIAKWISERGVIVGLCSKNNPEDIDKVLSDHKDMVLRDENIVIKKVNWQDKASNIKDIAKELNIGLDSILFVDDSDFEINLIKESLPSVATMQVPTSAIYKYPNELLKLINRYFYISTKQEDLAKTAQYKQQAMRSASERQYASIDDYLASLDIKIHIAVDDKDNISRIAQLTNKTNQFNLTTHRYTETEIMEFMNSDKLNVYSISVTDKFGDNGTTAVVITKQDDNVSSVIDSFLMSCRVMGRNIEFAVIDYIVSKLRERGIKSLKASFVPTVKNKPVVMFYEDAGFVLQKNTVEEVSLGEKMYDLNTVDYKSHNIKYIKIE